MPDFERRIRPSLRQAAANDHYPSELNSVDLPPPVKLHFGVVALIMSTVLVAAAADSPAPVAKSPSSKEAPQTDRTGLVKAANGSWVTVEEKNALDAAAQAVAVATEKVARAAIEKTNPRHLPAFPGAEGFGALAIGGRGGEIVHVTNLRDSGPGSFREAVSRPSRIVVFDVGGIVDLATVVPVSSNLTILGQTAPGEGICFYRNSVTLDNASNVIVRYLRFCQGIAGDRSQKAFGMARKCSNIIVDHCSIEWGRWDDLGITVGSSTITVQNCIMAEGIHPQSFGALIDMVTDITLSHNLWMSNESRNPKANGTVQYVNNVVYNWGYTGLCGGHEGIDRRLDLIGNYFIAGPSSNDRFAGQFWATDHVYQEGNFVDLDRDGKLNGTLAAPEDFHRADESGYTLPTFINEPTLHPPIPVVADSAEQAYIKVASGAGCSLHRDPVDLRLIGELTSLGLKGQTLPHTDAQGEALAGGIGKIDGGIPPVDSDRDGIPDAFEKAHGLDPRNPADAAKSDASGYMNIEVYANSLVAPAPAMTTK